MIVRKKRSRSAFYLTTTYLVVCVIAFIYVLAASDYRRATFSIETRLNSSFILQSDEVFE